MTGFEAYQLYLAVKLHFTSDSYDFVKYKGQTRSASQSTYQKRKDKYLFEKLAKVCPSDELVPFIIANFLHNPCYVIHLLEPEAANRYMDWKRRIESLPYIFENECKKLVSQLDPNDIHNEFNSLFSTKEFSHPTLLLMLLQQDLSFECFVILDSLLGFSKKWDSDLSGDPIWEETSSKSKKYYTFLHINLQKYRKLLKALLKNADQAHK